MQQSVFKNLIMDSKSDISNTDKLYHGQNRRGNPFKDMKKYIKTGNQQEGPGVYFGSYTVASSYGNFIYETIETISEINQNKIFLPSRKPISTVKMFYNRLPELFRNLSKKSDDNLENMFYLISDWIEIYEPEDLLDNDSIFDDFAKSIKNDDARNFFITMADNFGGDFVDEFNKIYPKIYGLFNDDLNYYVFLKPIETRELH